MMFTDPAFLFVFLPIVISLYKVLPKPLHNAFLLAASLGFYAGGEGLRVWVLFASILINYAFGIALTASGTAGQRKGLLAGGIVLNLLLLSAFKYVGFVIENVNHLREALTLAPIPTPTIALPAGISFFTFMGLSYLIDLYGKHVEVEKNPATFGLYLSLFPHLIAGPIVRLSDIASQLHNRRASAADTVAGIQRFILGLGKKMLIGNTLGVAVDGIFKLPASQLTASTAWVGILCYTLQIYYDFSGYSDMAIGLARIFGFVFPENFNYPYISQSISEFWRRWHITLSTWMRDYLFFPLAVRGPRSVLYRNTLIVFLLCGFWHGASWHFAAWGLCHGVFLVIERMGLTESLNGRSAAIRHVYTLIAVMTGWVLFRAESLSMAGAYFAALLGFSQPGAGAVTASWYLGPDILLAFLAGVAGAVPLVPYIKRQVARRPGALALLGSLEFAGAAAIFVVSCSLAAAGTYNPFIYFRF